MAFRVIGTEANEVAVSATYAIDSLETTLRPTRVESVPSSTVGRDPVPVGDLRMLLDADDKTHLYTRLIGAGNLPQWKEVSLLNIGESQSFYLNDTGLITVLDESTLLLEQDGAGDVGIQFERTGGQIYTLGTDTSDSDAFKLHDLTAGVDVLKLDISTGNATFSGTVSATSLTLSGLTASRLMATDGSKAAASVSDLTSWIAAGEGLTIANDGDGTATLGTDGVLEDLVTTGVVGANSEFLVGTGAGAMSWENPATAATSMGLGTGNTVQFEHLGLGGARTEGSLHINPGAAGSVTAIAQYDDLVIESSGSAGISILSPPTEYGGLLFGTSVDNFSAGIFWSEPLGVLEMTTLAGANPNAKLLFKVYNYALALTLDGDTNATFTGDLRVDGGDIGISGDTDLMQLAANSLTVNGTFNMADNSLIGANHISFTDTAGTIAGIQNQNLVDKTATENVTGTWQIARLGINGAITDGDLQVNPGAAGSVTASSAWNNVVIEDSSHSAISIFGGTTSYKGLVFGDSTDSFAAALLWASNILTLSCYSTSSTAKIQFKVYNGHLALTLESDKNATFVGDIRVDGGDIGISADTNLIQLAANQVDINGALDVNGTTPALYMIESDGSANENWAFTVAGGELYISTATDAKSRSTRVLIRRDGALLCDNVSSNPATPSNSAGIFAKDVSFSAECFTIDEADNVTQISPHDPLTGETYLNTYNTRTNRSLILRNERFIRRMIAKYPGEFDDCIEEFDGEYGHSS
jgi:hypothetical protein